MCCHHSIDKKKQELSDEMQSIKDYVDLKNKEMSDKLMLKIKQAIIILTNHDKEIFNKVDLKIDNAMDNIKDKCKIDPNWESK